MLQQSAEKVKMAKKIESDVEAILVYYKELDKTAKRFHKQFLVVQKPYFKHLHKMQKIIARKTDWKKFSKQEKLTVKNTITLAQLLHRMCAVQLVLNAPTATALEQVNTSEVERMIADVNRILTISQV